MADSATKETLDCTKQKQFRIGKLKLPTLAEEIYIKSQLKLSHGDSLPLHFDLRSEADNGPPLLAALISNVILRTRGGSSGAQRISIRLQEPAFIPNNPLDNFAALFSEIQQELVTEVRKFSLIQSEYLKECIKRSRSTTINRTIKTSETANDAVFQFRNNVAFLVRLFFEVMEGPKDIKFEAACEIPSLPDIYSVKESKAAFDMPSLPDNRSVKQLTDAAASLQNRQVSGFNSLFTTKRK